MATYTSPYPATAGQYGSQISPQFSNKPALPRTISTTNLQITKQCQDLVQKDLCISFPSGGTCFFVELPGFTFTIPNLGDYPPDFRKFVFDRIIDSTVKKSLEEESCLNWFPSATKLEPLNTQGDGNCLLHAASLGMWGFQDRDLILRNAVSQAVSHAAQGTNTLYIRWKYNKEQECHQQGYKLEDAQWQKEWETVVRQASPELTPTNTLYSLEEFHVFVLANVLRRPVIMYASRKMRSLNSGGTMQSINFHGVYLPLLWHPNGCKKDPLPLSYQSGHFSALVVIDSAQQYRDGKLILPLAGSDGIPLPVRFTLNNENVRELLNEYLSVTNVTNPLGQYTVPCATLNMQTRPTYYDRLVGAFINACHSAYLPQQPQPYSQAGYPVAGGVASSQNERYQSPATAPVYSTPSNGQNTGGGQSEKLKCINNCGQYGDPKTAGLCSRCHEKILAATLEQEIPSATPTSSVSNNNTTPVGMSGPTSIKCPNCTRPGHPKYLGMCENCYGNQNEHTQPQSQPQQPYYDNQSRTQPQYGNQAYAQTQYRKEAYTQPQYGNQSAQYGTQPQYRNQQTPYQNQSQSVYRNEPGPQPQYGNQGAQQRENPYESLENYQQKPNDPSVKPESAPPPVPLPRSTASPEERKQCRTPSCEFFGTEQTRFYCSKCFEENMASIFQETNKSSRVPTNPPVVHQHQPYTTPQLPPASQEPEKCIWCHEYFGSPMYGGLCHGCFKRSTEAGSREKKCLACQEFYGSEQQRGLCNRCFLKQTEHDTHGTTTGQRQPIEQSPLSTADLPPADYSFSQPPLPSKPSGHLPHSQSEVYNTAAALQPSEFKQVTEPQISVPPQMTKPIPKPRPRPRTSVNTTSSTTNSASGMLNAMGAMAISNTNQTTLDCFMCSGRAPGPSSSSSLCPKHTELVTKMIPLGTSGDHQPQPSYPNPISTHQTQAYTTSAPHPSPHRPAVSQGHIQTYGQNTASSSQHQMQHYNVSSADQVRGGAGEYAEVVKSKPYQPAMVPSYLDQQGSQFTQTPVSHPGPSQTNPGGTIATLNDFNTNKGGSGVPAHYQQEEMIAVGVGLQSRQQTQGAMPGGATGTGSMVKGAEEGGIKEKLLCNTAGCSFYAIPELNNLCNDCYKEHYEKNR